ncbi:diol dehydratase reactivase ATPase-like domain-containing protein [Nonomuraea harbinensis]|uniref:Diol dehydratase reactivase ATPase-like domain-containing protein n=1 Tax=Nonomuraea harbinensis TaxID=1286938 RepID=A0ABW1BYL4_9ACTN|nr:diol dehydratase reactivase ATPase-like domain-containing protein [Nonomuraea harbinensis]
MTVVAGVDIGNSTTEIVLARAARGGVEVLASARGMTRGTKGSAESLTAAARLVLRTAASCSVRVDSACLAPAHPVRTACRAGGRAPAGTGPLRLLTRAATTAAGDAVAAGRPVTLDALRVRRHGSPADADRLDALVVVVPAGVAYDHAAGQINEARRAGADIVAVLVERDEAVLIANRLGDRLPVVDGVPPGELGASELVAVEARPHGRPLRRLADPYWVADTFGIPAASPYVRALTHELADSSYAVVALLADDDGRRGETPSTETGDWLRWSDGTIADLTGTVDRLRRSPPGRVSAVRWAGPRWDSVDDVYAVHLDAIARQARSRRGTVGVDQVITAVLDSGPLPVADPARVLAEALDAPVSLAGSEAAAGRAGALTTPGCPGDAVIADLGGGTIDVSAGDRRLVLAGAGEMLTTVTAKALAIPMGLADHAKRVPALHADSPHVVIDEKGGRAFLDAPLSGGAVGALCVEGPVGLLPFNRSLGLGEWRAWRMAAKAETIGRNVVRALDAFGVAEALPLLVVGGAAGDDEVLASIAECLPPGSTVGRGNVAGSLGHRYAVAYGLAQRGLECA